MTQHVSYYSIDRFEEDFAVCEDDNGTFLHIPRSEIAPEAREGDVLKSLSQKKYVVDIEETSRRRRQAIALQRSLFE